MCLNSEKIEKKLFEVIFFCKYLQIYKQMSTHSLYKNLKINYVLEKYMRYS